MEIAVETICDWLAGRLDEEMTARVSARVEEDRKLAAQVKWLRLLTKDRPDFRISDPPPGLRERLVTLFDERESKFEDFERLVAELISDSLDGQPAPGMRGGAFDAEARHLLFSCQLFDVSVTLSRRPHDDQFDLKGEILAPRGLDPVSCSVELVSEVGQTRLDESDCTGEFRFPKLPEGKYRLKVLGPGFEVGTPEFDVH